MKRCWMLVAALVVVLAGCKRGEQAVDKPAEPATAGGTSAATSTGIEPGTVMPEYTSLNLDGSKFDLAARREKVVLLNLWATWCGPCRYEIPELQRIHNAYAGRGFEVVGVSVDQTPVDAVREFVTEHKMTYPVVHDQEERLAGLLEASVLPTSVLIGRDGKIIWKKVGAILENDQELKSAIEKAL
ncbi:MAG TPA: TlpA disulfide reductase family protein [Thermoanaerobaculia bacterium]|nr:TlpA disulfide reductase family protein [Thermoanaerobaculia bacterium]